MMFDRISFSIGNWTLKMLLKIYIMTMDGLNVKSELLKLCLCIVCGHCVGKPFGCMDVVDQLIVKA